MGLNSLKECLLNRIPHFQPWGIKPAAPSVPLVEDSFAPLVIWLPRDT